MSSNAYSAPTAAIQILIRGGGDVGSAVAHVLFRRGAKVLICELTRSPHARRGMAFTDALFDGSATLEGVVAQWVPDVAAVRDCWREGGRVPLITMAESLLTAAIRFDVVIDATMRRESVRQDLRPMSACTIGLGPGYIPGVNCHIAIETQWGEAMGQVLHDRAAAVRSGGPHPLDGVTHERFVPAHASGVWRTNAVLGQSIRAGELVGQLGDEAVRAPIDGHLRGLTRDGVAVVAGQRLVEVDPRSAPETAGLGERPLAIAAGILSALESRLPLRGRA
jgi:xanthine dehydrogenase accessory factor